MYEMTGCIDALLRAYNYQDTDEDTTGGTYLDCVLSPFSCSLCS